MSQYWYIITNYILYISLDTFCCTFQGPFIFPYVCVIFSCFHQSHSFQSTGLLPPSVQLFSCVWLFATPWTAAHQGSLSITNSWSLLKLMSIKSAMPSNHLLSSPSPPTFNLPSIRVFSTESVLCTRWPKYLELQLQYESFQRIFRTDFL